MIENDRQLEITRGEIRKFEAALNRSLDQIEQSDLIRLAMVRGMESMLAELRAQEAEYIRRKEAENADH